MVTLLDVPSNLLNPYQQAFVADVREHGWRNTCVAAGHEGPDFAYTTGFWLNLNAPEVIVFSLDPRHAHAVLWDLYQALKSGAKFPTGQRLDGIFKDRAAMLLPVAEQHFPDYLGWTGWFYWKDYVPSVQLVWSDRAGRFPWESKFSKRSAQQPDLSESGWAKAA